MEKGKKKINKGILIKITVPILIAFVIIGIYVYKKTEDGKINTSNNVEEEVENSIPLEISSVDLDDIKSHGIPFIIDFGSDSCAPCRQMAPTLEKVYEEYQGKAIIHFIDVWKNQTAADNFPVSVIPTQVFYTADGKPFVPSDKLSKEIEFTLYRSKTDNEHVFTVHQGGVTEDEMKKILSEMGV